MAKAKWQQYCTTFQSGATTSRPVWRAIASMQGKSSIPTIPSITIAYNILTDFKAKVDALARHFASIGDESSYNEPFSSIKKYMDFHTKAILRRNESIGNDEPFNRKLQMTTQNSSR
jgi:hypothetical protein